MVAAASGIPPDSRPADQRDPDDDRLPARLTLVWEEPGAAGRHRPTAPSLPSPTQTIGVSGGRGDQSPMCAAVCASGASPPQSRQVHSRPGGSLTWGFGRWRTTRNIVPSNCELQGTPEVGRQTVSVPAAGQLVLDGSTDPV